MPSATTLNIASIIAHHARLTPEKAAVTVAEKTVSYGELDSLSGKVAAALIKNGIRQNDKVALLCPNLIYFPIIYFGILKAGAVVVPLCVLFKSSEIEFQLKDSEAKILFAFEGTDEFPMGKEAFKAFQNVASCQQFIALTKSPGAKSPFDGEKTFAEFISGAEPVNSPFPTSPDDTAAILYTSGTTGKPKGAELSHLNLWTNVVTAYSTHLPVLDFTDGQQKTALITLPLFHTTGQNVQMNSQLYAGNRIVLLPRFDPAAVLETMVKERVNFWVGVPTMYWELLRYIESTGFDTSKLRETVKVFASGGAPMPVEVLRRVEDVFGIRVLEGYGLSETSPLVCFNHFEKPSKPGTVGQPISGVEVMCVDENDNPVSAGQQGEIVVRGPNVMKGYYKSEEATAEVMKGGWFHTGDIGFIDDEGYLTIVDRKKDMILRGGYNVYPRELEELIMTHPAVALCAVIGVPDERLGEEIKAFLVLKPNAELTAEEFIDWCRQRMAANKYPRYVEFRNQLPIGNTGKISKLKLKQELKKSE
ncbi:MAG TPA: long-chain fatty acid--CoA ligase [Pyrinomonadaceae bacterium]|nr:long-chain fatty acid--CoA ligase [Pyrinomonadaceae bacterium]